MAGVSILVIRADDAFSEPLRNAGFSVTDLPLIKTRPLEDQSKLRDVLLRLDEYSGIFFTSPAAAEVFISEAGSVAAQTRLYAMGGRSQKLLEQAGYAVEDQRRGNTAAEFIASFDETEFRGKKLLFLRGDRSLLTIPTLLADKAQVEEVIVYETLENRPDQALLDQISQKLADGEFEWTCFFSPSGIESFSKAFEIGGLKKVAVIGNTTAAAAEKHGVKADFVSPRSSAKDFSRALAIHINGK